MNTAVNEYNYRFKLTDYSLFDRNRARKVAIYGRVSTEHEAQLSALENQLQWYDDQVKYHPNWTVCERYIDEGITGTQAKKRPAFLKMIEDAKQGKFDLIVTREVCRFARNVVDTLVVTRELKGIGVEVFFIDDNIWTMDGDGELRLSLMATLAQEESRKTSERVKAGQKISRDNGVLYGNGNILGYDRVGDTYVINEEQAETVRMIYDLYLQGYGSMKIAKILTERKRKTASGLIKWSVSNIMRAIKNATYTGTKCYNKSRSNNFLEQKRINNLDMSTYEYVEGDFPSIISQEIWNKAQAIRESRVKPVCVSAGKNTHSKRDSRDIWVNKLRCSCGSSYRKNKWHTKLDGKTSYGYQCYNQLNNGIKRKRAEIGLDTEGYCDSRMITDWKLDFMAKALLEHLWTERKESVLIALDLIKYYYKEEKSNETQSDTVTIQAKLDKANSRLTNLIAMRADGEISKDEYQAMRSPVDEEIKKLQKALDEIPQEKSNPKGLDIEGIRSTLNSLVDFSGSTISHDVVNRFVYLITPTSDTTFDWYVNLNGTADVKATFTAEGRKKNCIIKLEEIEKISSVHREKNEDNAHFIKNPHIFTYLHTLPQRAHSNQINSLAQRLFQIIVKCAQCEETSKLSSGCVYQQINVAVLICCSSCIGAKQIDGWKAILFGNRCDNLPDFINGVNHIWPSFALLFVCSSYHTKCFSASDCCRHHTSVHSSSMREEMLHHRECLSRASLFCTVPAQIHLDLSRMVTELHTGSVQHELLDSSILIYQLIFICFTDFRSKHKP